ncbi:MAG: OmpH family outer membrane protein [Armatimonadota bacterium]|nr:OmpH family outer membrane protein [Armatimonadota bacterium]MCX7777794.1 OmpH family outer membrane protein [Armatimonadota bacterium]MDW8025319.1 OmpH family outer membrane protein [Armatimonadota bacterium]
MRVSSTSEHKLKKHGEKLLTLICALWKPLAIGFVIAGIACAFGSFVSAQGEFKVGVIKMQALQRDFGEYREAMERLEEERRSYERQLAQLRSYPLLTATEIEELLKLSLKERPSESEQRRLLELRGLHAQRTDEFQRLSAAPFENLTPAQQQRLKELRTIAQENASRHSKLAEELQRKLNSLSEQMRNHIDRRIRETVAQVAHEEGFDMVFDREAVLFVRGKVVDITAQVLKRLNEGK